MESRILSGATIFPAFPRMHKSLTTRDIASFAASTRPTCEGSNIIWGCQLRPNLLLSASPALIAKRNTVHPVSAAASAPGGGNDSVGESKVAQVGFFGRYPFLLTGFLFFMWYFLNVIFNIINKKLYNYFPYPYFVSAVHLSVGVAYCLLSWLVGLPKRAPIDSNLLKLLIPVGVCHAIGHVTSNISFSTVAVSFTHTIKALEPFFNAAASQFVLGQHISLPLWLSLAPVVLGVSMASLTELSFNWTGFISAMISNVSFTYRSIYSKKAMVIYFTTLISSYLIKGMNVCTYEVSMNLKFTLKMFQCLFGIFEVRK